MRMWLSKFRISCALDSHPTSPERRRRKHECSLQLRRFADDAEELGRVLQASVPPIVGPPSLHRSIMDAVEAAERAVCPSRACTGTRRVAGRGLGVRPLAVGILAAVLLSLAVGWQWNARHKSRQLASVQALAPAGAALDASERLAQTLPQAMVAPLSEEWERLNRDLSRSAEFFLASVP